MFNAYGVLINGKAVCEGYSKAILMLLRMAGLEAKSVVGYGIDGTNKIPHAWNMVKINGVFTLLDSTWDDPVPDNKSQIYYNYFNVSQEQLLKAINGIRVNILRPQRFLYSKTTSKIQNMQ